MTFSQPVAGQLGPKTTRTLGIFRTQDESDPSLRQLGPNFETTRTQQQGRPCKQFLFYYVDKTCIKHTYLLEHQKDCLWEIVSPKDRIIQLDLIQTDTDCNSNTDLNVSLADRIIKRRLRTVMFIPSFASLSLLRRGGLVKPSISLAVYFGSYILKELKYATQLISIFTYVSDVLIKSFY